MLFVSILILQHLYLLRERRETRNHAVLVVIKILISIQIVHVYPLLHMSHVPIHFVHLVLKCNLIVQKLLV